MPLVEVRKWPQRPHASWHATVVGEDAFGLWLGVRADTPISSASATRVWWQHFDVVHLFPWSGWWVAGFHPPGPLRYRVQADDETRDGEMRGLDVYVDIALPAERGDDHVSFVDLELDVIRNPDGSVVVLDQDEFDDAALPAAVAQPALAATIEIERMLRDRTEPFGEVGARWLARFAGAAAS